MPMPRLVFVGFRIPALSIASKLRYFPEMDVAAEGTNSGDGMVQQNKGKVWPVLDFR